MFQCPRGEYRDTATYPETLVSWTDSNAPGKATGKTNVNKPKSRWKTTTQYTHDNWAGTDISWDYGMPFDNLNECPLYAKWQGSSDLKFEHIFTQTRYDIVLKNCSENIVRLNQTL